MCQEKKGKKWERERNGKGTCSFLSRSSIFGHPFFPVSSQNHEKRVKKEMRNGQKTAGKMWNGKEQPFFAIPDSRIWRDSVFYTVENPFLPPFQPIFYPVPMPFLPLSFPVLVPFLYCLAIISRCTLVAAQPLDHVGPSLVRGTSGRFVFTARRC